MIQNMERYRHMGETSADVWGNAPNRNGRMCFRRWSVCGTGGSTGVRACIPVAPSESALHFHTADNWLSTGCWWCESAFVLLSHQKVTKRLTVLFFYGIIGSSKWCPIMKKRSGGNTRCVLHLQQKGREFYRSNHCRYDGKRQHPAQQQNFPCRQRGQRTDGAERDLLQ